MFTLKDGTQTECKQLDRIKQFDPKSRDFPLSALYTQRPLRSYTWRCNQWLDQGTEGACVAFALGHELAARPAVVKNIQEKWLIEQVYWKAQQTDEWPGGSYPDASPFYEGTSVLAGVKVLHKLGFFKSYRWAFGLNDLLLGLGYNGPAVLGLNWYSGMTETDKDGFIHPTGRIVGGHAILARAVNIKEEFVTLRNSWGKSWGKDGDCYIKFSALEKLLKEDGEAVFLQGRTKVPMIEQ